MTIGMMCLGRAYDSFNRAKVMAIECNSECGIMVTVFFVDLGESRVLPMNDLLAIPRHLIEKEPFQVSDFVCRSFLFNNCPVRFQAILCSLVGIRPTNSDVDWDLDLCDRMYVEIMQPCTNMAMQPVKGRIGPKNDIGMPSYDCVLVDKDDDDQTSTINDSLVSSGLADYDSVDRHHLTLSRSASVLDLDDDSDTPENWDSDNYQRVQKCDATPNSNNSDEDGVKMFDYNFTDNEIMEAMRSLVSHVLSDHPQRLIIFIFVQVNLPSHPEQLFGNNTSESSGADITEITDNKSEPNSENDSEPEPFQSLNQPELLEPTDPEELYYRNIQIPALRRPAAVPNVKWQQGETVIMLVIEAPDVRDYYLQVTTRSLVYR